MKEKLLIHLFVESDAGAVQTIIHRGLREINGKDYPAERIEEYCAYFTLEKIKSQADSAHMYVAVANDKVVGTGSIAPYWGSETESILLDHLCPAGKDRTRHRHCHHQRFGTG